MKQDHQGPPGYAHGGVIATALDEAMALLLHDEGTHALTARLEVDLQAPAPVGSYVEVEAAVAERAGRRLVLSATAGNDDGVIASARGTFVRPATLRASGPT